LAGGPEALSDRELLAIIIGGGSVKDSALGLAERLLAHFGSFRVLAGCATGDLTAVHGIGPAKAARIQAALAIARRYSAERLPTSTPITGSRQIAEYMGEKLAGRQREYFCALLLDTKHCIIREEQVAEGSLNESIVHPREVFRNAIRESAAKVLFVHNHPSGNPAPSPQDRAVTKRLVDAGKLVGIDVLDHVIVGHKDYYSFAEHGQI
jgi:DNA repair protein RadC